MNTVTKLDHWKPATHSDPKPDPDPLARPIDFVLTDSEKTTAAIVRCDIEAMRRRFREPDGLTVTESTQSEWDKAREAFRRTL